MARERRKIVGAEQARQRLPELLERAHRGEVTIITKRGKPYAALVPIEAAARARPTATLTSLRGSGHGLWGDVASHVEQLRAEWS